MDFHWKECYNSTDTVKFIYKILILNREDGSCVVEIFYSKYLKKKKNLKRFKEKMKKKNATKVKFKGGNSMWNCVGFVSSS